jgi:DNA-binding NarL/FixJ family response regulator
LQYHIESNKKGSRIIINDNKIATQKQEAMQWRRDKVLEYTSHGYTQREIAAILQVSSSTIAEDQIFLRQ